MNQIILPLLFLLSPLTGCASAPRPPAQLAQFAGREVVLKQPCYLTEDITDHQNITLKTLWENGGPTDLVLDDRLFAQPAKTIEDYPFYPAADYRRRHYELTDDVQRIENLKAGNNEKGWDTGPHRVFYLPPGTQLLITRIYTVVPFLNEPCYYASGKVDIKEAGRELEFETYLGMTSIPHEPAWQ